MSEFRKGQGMKEDFIKMWKQGLVAAPIHADGSINRDCIPTVTKADICREFSKEVIKRYRADSTKGFANIMAEVLGEMEKEE